VGLLRHYRGDPVPSSRAFLATVASRRCADLVRQAGRDQSTTGPELPDVPTAAPGPEDAVIASDVFASSPALGGGRHPHDGPAAAPGAWTECIRGHARRAPNLTTTGACRACLRAHQTWLLAANRPLLRQVGKAALVQREADRHYAEIMNTAVGDG
jgi:hypothetical protein